MKNAVQKIKVLDGAAPPRRKRGGGGAADKVSNGKTASAELVQAAQAAGAQDSAPGAQAARGAAALGVRRQLSRLEDRAALLRFAIQEAKEAIAGK